METADSNESTTSGPVVSGGDGASRIGPAGRRAETAWNSRERQRDFGSLDSDLSTPLPPPSDRRIKTAGPRPTWPIAVAIVAVLGGGIAFLARHPAPAAKETVSSTEASTDKGEKESSTSAKTTKQFSAAHHPKGSIAKRKHIDTVRGRENRPAISDEIDRPRRPEPRIEVRPRPEKAPPSSLTEVHPQPAASVVVQAPPAAPSPPPAEPKGPDTAAERAKKLLDGG